MVEAGLNSIDNETSILLAIKVIYTKIMWIQTCSSVARPLSQWTLLKTFGFICI